MIKKIGEDKYGDFITVNHRILSSDENTINGTLTIIGEGFYDDWDTDGLEYNINLNDKSCELVNIIVQDKRRGLGTLLFKELELIAKECNCEVIWGSMLDASDYNSKSQVEQRNQFYREQKCHFNDHNFVKYI